MTLVNRNDIVKSFLKDMSSRHNLFFSDYPKTDFLVLCDETNNTDESIARGELKVDFVPHQKPYGYKMEYKGFRFGEREMVLPPDWDKHRDRTDIIKRLTAYIEKAIADAFNFPLFALEQKQVDNTTKELVDEIASLKAEVAVLNARDIENKRVIEEAMKLNNELEKELVTAEKKLAIFEKWEPVLASSLQKKKSSPVIRAINKIGKAPHAAWYTIVDNENEGQL